MLRAPKAFGSFMIVGPTLECSHWWEIVYTECCHDAILDVTLQCHEAVFELC